MAKRSYKVFKDADKVIIHDGFTESVHEGTITLAAVKEFVGVPTDAPIRIIRRTMNFKKYEAVISKKTFTVTRVVL